jgi:hypothetical protein
MAALWPGKVSGELATGARKPVHRSRNITKYQHHDKPLQIIQLRTSAMQNLDIDQ